jgi:heptosyltransferase-2
MFVKKIKRRIKNRFIKKGMRKLKEIYFIIIDFLGRFIFYLPKLLKLIPQEKFSKEKIKKILIIRTDRIGDVILSTPTVRALRENFPKSFIGFLTTSYTEELVCENKDINEIIVYERKWSLIQKINFIKKLKNYKFDLAVILSPYFESALFGYLSKATFRVGYSLNGAGFLLTKKVDISSRYKHEIESCLDVVRTIGIDTTNKRPVFVLSKKAEEFAQKFFDEHKILPSDLKICIHPGGYEEHKRWMPSRYAQIADILIKEYKAKVILLGAKTDKKILNEILKFMSEKPIVPNLNDSLQKLGAIIKKCDIFLGNNSGPMHVASGVGTRVVAIFGAIHPLEHENKWAPFGEEHIIVRKKMDCIDCHPGHCKDYKCMEAITVEDVLKALEIQIKKIKNG